VNTDYVGAEEVVERSCAQFHGSGSSESGSSDFPSRHIRFVTQNVLL